MDLSRSLAVLECLMASALTFVLLGLPLWLPAWRPLQGWFAAVWVLQQLWVVLAFGCTSLFARLLSIYVTQVREKLVQFRCSAGCICLLSCKAWHGLQGARVCSTECISGA